MKLFKLALFTALAASSLAFADTASAQPQGEGPFHEHMMARMKDKLGLTDAQAQQMATAFQSFKPRREALHQQMRVAMDSLRSAADGDPAALQQLSATEQKLADLRSQ